MKKHLALFLTTSCTLAFCDSFAPIDYAPLEEFTEENKLISFTGESEDLNLLADKEYFPEPEGGATLGSSPLNIDSTPLPSQPQDTSAPKSAPDYFPQGQESIPGSPEIPTPRMDPKKDAAQPVETP